MAEILGEGSRALPDVGLALGRILDGPDVVDQAVVACEGSGHVAIHCHGNPLITEQLMDLLGRHGVRLTHAEEVLDRLHADAADNAIAREAIIEQCKAVTVEGVKLIGRQAAEGLAAWASRWLESIDDAGIARLRAEARTILDCSRPAWRLIHGCKAAIVGPPNSGKSTLFNALCGRQKAIVTDVPGTTRDWLNASCRVADMVLELFDTAGLDAALARQGKVDAAAQHRTRDVAAAADLILVVLDASERGGDCCGLDLERKPAIAVLNKADLPQRLTEKDVTFAHDACVSMSAKAGTGLNELAKAIRRVTGVADLRPHEPICFTTRQERLLQHLAIETQSIAAKGLIAELLGL